MVSKARFTRTGGMPSFSSKVVRLEEKPPRVSCSFRIKICVLMCVLIEDSSYSSMILTNFAGAAQVFNLQSFSINNVVLLLFITRRSRSR